MAAVVARQRNVSYTGRDFRMVIASEDGSLEFGVPFAPLGVEQAGLATIWTEVPRPAEASILSESGDALMTMTFEILLAHRDNESVEGQLSRLRALAATDDRVIVSYGPSETGKWRFTDLSTSSILRDEDDNISQATASCTFTEVSDYDVALSPLGGGHVSSTNKKIPAKTKVQKGETLVKLSIRIYGEAKYWRAIADHPKNKIKNPKRTTKLKPGTVIWLPDRKKPKDKKDKKKPGGNKKKDND